jgi:flagellar motor protein MotB
MRNRAGPGSIGPPNQTLLAAVSRVGRARWLFALTLAALAGCASNPMVMKGQLDKSRQEQLALSRQNEELQNRATRLDRDNQDLMNQLTQAKQRTKILEDQLNVLREQLVASNSQLARLTDEKKSTEQKVQALTASLQRQTGAQITPNSSLLQTLPTIQLPDVPPPRRDGDVIRVELPAHRLFEPGSNRLRPDAAAIILTAAKEIARLYPNQIIGIEGHTDSDPPPAGMWQNNHQLSIGRALAVYDVLVAQGRFPASQFLVVGHGGNHPIFSNATPAGKQRNARVELVIYPDTVARQ